MRTRPVFESYSDFVNALYEMENEIPGFIDGLDGALSEAVVLPPQAESGNSSSLPSIVALFNSKNLRNGLGSSIAQDILTPYSTFLQICASSNPGVAKKIESIGKYMTDLLTKDFIAQRNWPRFETVSTDIFKTKAIFYSHADGTMVRVKGAPNADSSSVVKGEQTMSAMDLCGRIAAYNASIQQKAFETMMKSIDKEGEFKRAKEGKFKSNWFMKIFGKQNIDGVYESGSMKDSLYITEVGGKTGPVLQVLPLSASKNDTVNQTILDDKGCASFGQFKYAFPVITSFDNSGSPLEITTRTELVLPDNTRKTDDFDGELAVTPPSDKVNFYVVNKADMTDEGKAAIAGILNQFAKIDKLVVMGSADNRKPTGWKDNNELAAARRDVTIKYLEELSKQEGTSLTGATIEKGAVTVQPAGETSNYDMWRSVRIKPSGKIYSDLNDKLEQNEEIKAKAVTYTEKKIGNRISFRNMAICFAFDGTKIDSKEERKKSLSNKSDIEGEG
jgi:flagellar motor protein MotB